MHGEKAGTELNRSMLASNGGLLSKVYEHSEPTKVENLANRTYPVRIFRNKREVQTCDKERSVAHSLPTGDTMTTAHNGISAMHDCTGRIHVFKPQRNQARLSRQMTYTYNTFIGDIQ